MTNLKELEQKYAELGAEIERLKAGPEPKAGQVWVRGSDDPMFPDQPYMVVCDKRLINLNSGGQWGSDSLFGGVGKRGFKFAANSVEEYYRDRT